MNSIYLRITPPNVAKLSPASVYNEQCKILSNGDSVKFNKLCVIGLGYIGLPTASTFAMQGINVIGVDVNSHVIETLNQGEIHIHEPGLREVFGKAVQAGKFK